MFIVGFLILFIWQLLLLFSYVKLRINYDVGQCFSFSLSRSFHIINCAVSLNCPLFILLFRAALFDLCFVMISRQLKEPYYTYGLYRYFSFASSLDFFSPPPSFQIGYLGTDTQNWRVVMSTVVDGTRIRWQNLLENKIKKKEKQPWMNCQFESAGRHQQATVLKFKPTNLCSFFTSPFLSSRILFTHMTVFFARFVIVLLYQLYVRMFVCAVCALSRLISNAKEERNNSKKKSRFVSAFTWYIENKREIYYGEVQKSLVVYSFTYRQI